MTATGAISNSCPCCGGVLSSREKPTVDLDTNTLLFHDKAIRLTPSQAELVETLLRAMPGVVTYERLASGLYGGLNGPNNEIGVIQVLIFRLRPLLKSAGLSIETHRTRGVSLSRMEKAV